MLCFSANMCFGALAVVMLLILVAVLLTLVVVLQIYVCCNTNTDHSSSNTCSTVAQVALITLAVVRLRPAAVLLMRVVVLKHY